MRRHPELAGLPVIVGGNGDPNEPRKVVTCASYPAREFGVHAGMPLRTAARRNARTPRSCRPDTDAYDEASEQVMGLLRDFGHPVEVWGWDEAYVGADVDDPFELAEQIREVIAAETGLSCSVGISDNKQRAKVATGFGKPAGIYALTEDNWMAVMGDRGVDALWGVGPKTAKKLAGLGITTVADLAATDATLPHVDVRADHRAVDPAAGQGRRRHQVSAEPWVPRSRSHVVTFPEDLTERAEMDSAVDRTRPADTCRDRRAGPGRHPGRRDGAHEDVLHPDQDPQAPSPSTDAGGHRRTALELSRPVRARPPGPASRRPAGTAIRAGAATVGTDA